MLCQSQVSFHYSKNLTFYLFYDSITPRKEKGSFVMEKELYNDSLETLEDALDSLIKQKDLENSYEYIISRVCTKKSNGVVACDIYPLLGNRPDESKKVTILEILKIVYGEDAYKHESIKDLFTKAARELVIPITINSNEELLDFCVNARDIINNKFNNPKDRKAYGTIMYGIQSGIARSLVLLGQRKHKVKLCIDTLNDIIRKVKKNILVDIKNEEEFYRYLDEIVYVINKEDQLFSDLVKMFVEEFNKEVKQEELDKKIMKYYTKIEKTCTNNLKNIYKVMPKYTDSEFYSYMDGIEAMYEENMPKNYAAATAFLGFHRYGKVQNDIKERKSIK